jgi:predicted small secreted protein
MSFRLVPATLAVVALLTSACATTLAPGAADVKILRDSSAVSACVPVGNLAPNATTPGYAEADARNLTIGFGGNTLLVTDQMLGSLIAGVAYRCP